MKRTLQHHLDSLPHALRNQFSDLLNPLLDNPRVSLDFISGRGNERKWAGARVATVTLLVDESRFQYISLTLTINPRRRNADNPKVGALYVETPSMTAHVPNGGVIDLTKLPMLR